MLLSFLAWKITKITYLTALTLAFILMMVQIFKIGFILFGLPASASAPFFLVWFVYYTFFFIPDGVIVSTALVLYELKEKKLLHVLYSFHLSPYRLLLFFSLPALAFFFISLALTPFLFEEHVSFARRGLLIQFKDKIFENIPERTFLSSVDLVIYTGRKKGKTLENIFLKYKDTYILSREAIYKGKGRFLFRQGSLLTKEKGKYLVMEFKEYYLDTEEYITAGIRERKVLEGKMLNLTNSLLVLPLFFISFFGALRFCKTHLQVYLLITVCIILHQLIVFAVKLIL